MIAPVLIKRLYWLWNKEACTFACKNCRFPLQALL